MGSGNESVGLAQPLVVGDAETDDTTVRVSGCEQGDSFSLIARCAPAHSQQEGYPDASGSSRVMARVDHDLHRLVQAAEMTRVRARVNLQLQPPGAFRSVVCGRFSDDSAYVFCGLNRLPRRVVPELKMRPFSASVTPAGFFVHQLRWERDSIFVGKLSYRGKARGTGEVQM